MTEKKVEDKKLKQPEFDLIEALNQKKKGEKIKFDGATIAFTLPDGSTGTWVVCRDLGVRLRLIEEGKIQQKMMELQAEDLARKSIMASMPESQQKGGNSYLG